MERINLNISRTLDQVRDYYSAHFDYHISKRDIGGIYPAHFDLFRPRSFRSYQPASIADIRKVDESFSNGIFKSFMCNMCASGERNAIYQRQNLGRGVFLSPEDNPAEAVRTNININGINFIISGTYPVFLKDHLIMYPLEHISTHLILLSYPHFNAIYKVLSDNPEATAIFTGDQFSSIFHGHVHLTNFDYKIRRDLQKNISSDAGKINYDYGAIRSLVFYDVNVNRLHQNVAKYIIAYLENREILRGRHLTATLFVANRINFFSISLISDDTSIVLKDRTLYMIPSAYTLIMGNDFDNNVSREVDIALKNSDIWADMNTLDYLDSRTNSLEILDSKINISDGRVDLLTSNIIQWNILKFKERTRGETFSRLPSGDELCVDMPDILFDFQECLNSLETCHKTQIFGPYKFSLTLTVLCNLHRYRKKGDSDPIKSLFTDTRLSNVLFANYIYNLVDTYQVDKIPSVLVYSHVQIKKIIETFNDFIRVTGNNPKIRNRNKAITNWLSYQFQRQGTDSVWGKVTKASLKKFAEIPPYEMNMIVKLMPIFDENRKALARNEMSIGVQLNVYRELTPNIMATYGLIECLTKAEMVNKVDDYGNPYRELEYVGVCQEDEVDPNNNNEVSYLFLEYVDGLTFQELLRQPDKIPNMNLRVRAGKGVTVMALLAQCLLSLAYINYFTGFVHNDCHMGNIMVRLEYPLNSHARYTWPRQRHIIRTPLITTFIDYGLSYARGVHDIYPKMSPTNVHSINRKNSTKDVFAMIISFFEDMVKVYRQNIMQSPLFRQFFDRFSKVFEKFLEKPLMKLLDDGDINENNMSDLPQILKKVNKTIRNIDATFIYLAEENQGLNYGPLDAFLDLKDIMTQGGYGELFTADDDDVCEISNKPYDCLGLDLAEKSIERRKMTDFARRNYE